MSMEKTRRGWLVLGEGREIYQAPWDKALEGMEYLEVGIGQAISYLRVAIPTGAVGGHWAGHLARFARYQELSKRAIFYLKRELEERDKQLTTANATIERLEKAAARCLCNGLVIDEGDQ